MHQWYKVGKALSTTKRLKSYQTGNPTEFPAYFIFKRSTYAPELVEIVIKYFLSEYGDGNTEMYKINVDQLTSTLDEIMTKVDEIKDTVNLGIDNSIPVWDLVKMVPNMEPHLEMPQLTEKKKWDICTKAVEEASVDKNVLTLKDIRDNLRSESKLTTYERVKEEFSAIVRPVVKQINAITGRDPPLKMTLK